MAAPYQYPQYQQQAQYQAPQQQDYSAYNQQQYPQQAYQTQQYQPQQQYAYQQYPQQQAQQGYQSQQYQAHTQYPPQYATQPAHPQSQPQQPSYGQQTPQPPPSSQPHAQTCFNCGAPGHWAQDCPEPKREVPAGKLNPEQHRRHGIAPHKRHNTIVTKFGPQGNSNQSSPQSYGQPYSAGAYSQYSSPYTASPHSASTSTHQWPQNHPQQQQQQHQPQYQQFQPSAQGSQYYAAPPTPSHSYPTSATPTSAQPYGPPQTPQASTPTSHYAYDPQQPFVQQAPQQGQRTPSYGQPQPPPPPQQTSHQGWHQSPTPVQQPSGQPSSAGSPPVALASHRNSFHASASFEIPTGHPEEELEEGEEAETDEIEEDDINALDLPDLPPSTKQYGDAVVPPIALPLPGNSVVADALAPFARASAEDGYRCRSKYWRSTDDEALFQNIEDTIHWKDVKEDIMFRPMSLDDEVVSLDTCRSQIKERQKPQDQALRDSRSGSRSIPNARRDAAECAESLQQLERALAEAKAKQAELISKRQAELDKKRKSKGDQRSPSQEYKQFGREPAVKTERTSPPNFAFSRTPTRQDSMSTPRHSEQSPSDVINNPFGRSSKVEPNKSNGHHQHYDAPPPPPPPDAQHSSPDDGSPLSGGIDPYGYGTNTTENGNGYFNYHGEHHHPPGLRSEHSGSRKRTYESSSDDSDTPARRQADDVTPKLKRRQPKVADAYSRRW